MVKENKHVTHPRDVIKECREGESWLFQKINGGLDVLCNTVLPHEAHTIIAFILPLIVATYVILSPSADSTKLLVTLLALFAQSWIQWWALPALQRSQVQADMKRDAKADADHHALTHIANQVDKLVEKVK